MKNFKFNPTILSSTNYSIFKFIRDNRDVNPLHLKRLKSSFQSNWLFSPILVNQKHEIIDGQHRFSVCQELGLPIYYIMVYNYGINEVQILNTNHNNWNKKDYLQGYINSGNENYIEFKKFATTYPDFNFTTSLRILSGLRTYKTTRFEGTKNNSKTFENGTFEIPDRLRSYEIANMIMDFKKFFPRFNDNVFVTTLLYLFDHVNYNHKEMIKKMVVQPNSLELCRSQTQYALLIEDIYNFKRKDKVSLRY